MTETSDRVLDRRAPFPKLRSTSARPNGESVGLHVKFREGSRVRLRGGEFVVDGRPLRAVMAALENYGGVRPARLFTRPEPDLANEKARIEARSGREQADKNLWYRLGVPAGSDVARLADVLNAFALVEVAYPEPMLSVPEHEDEHAPDFVPLQGYRGAAPDGIDADWARSVPGGRGENAKVTDIELGWRENHQDLTRSKGKMRLHGTHESEEDHGTAVLGELVGDDNGYGVTGLSDRAEVAMVGTAGADLAGAIDLAHSESAAGDVILIELQVAGCPSCGDSWAPVEAVPAWYDSITAAVDDGVIVVEAAGNGSQNLDDEAKFGDPFPAGRPDSGAIIVGAGNAPGCTNPPRGRSSFSNHGSRVDVHGWGQCVATTGYGDLWKSCQPGVVAGGVTLTEECDADTSYTDGFSGTSSASPMAAAAAVVVSSVAQQRGGLLAPRDVRALLRATGTPQATTGGALPGHVGPLPNLRKALDALGGETATILTTNPNPSAFGQAVTLTATVTSSAGTPSGVVRFADGSTPLGAIELDAAGVAAFTTTALGVGSHSLTAAYDGNGRYEASTSSAATHVVDKAATTTVVTGDAPDPSAVGQAVTVAFSVTSPGGAPTGTVTVTGGAHTCSASVTAGSCALYFSSTGPKTLTASYGGNASFAGSSDTESHEVQMAPTATALKTSPNPSTVGHAVTLTATVTSATVTPRGTVRFTDGETLLGSDDLDGSGVATFTTTSFGAGSHSLIASYEGDETHESSTSPTVAQTVTTTPPPASPSQTTTTAPATAPPATAPSTTAPPADGSAPTTSPHHIPVGPAGRGSAGYRMTATDGGVFVFGAAGFFGSTGALRLAEPIVAMAATPTGGGYWLAAADGGVFAFGDAAFFGSTGALELNSPIVDIVAAAAGDGYWLVAADGGIFAFGPGARFFGSTGTSRLNSPIVAMAAAPAGDGYWLVAADGGIFSFGPGARFFGSTGASVLNRPVVSIAATPTAEGYWLVASDGGVFAFGDARFLGSTGNRTLRAPIVAIAATQRQSGGYWLVAADGGVFAFGPDARFFGSTGDLPLNQPIVDFTPV